MPKPPPTKPKTWPRLAYGEGSWVWDTARKCCVLQHFVEGTRYRERGRTPAECLAKRDARRTAVTANAKLTDNGTATMAELWAQWLEVASIDKAPGTVDGYRYAIGLAAPLADRLVAELDLADVERLLVGLVRDGYAAATVAQVRALLVMSLDYGVSHRYLAANPTRSLTLSQRAGKPARPAVWLDELEFEPMRRHLVTKPSTLNTVLLLMLLTGMRPGEALGLKWDAIDWARNRVHVRSAVQASNNGRTKTVVPELKTATSYRTLELPRDLVVALKRERAAQRERRIAAKTWADPELVFTTSTGRLMSRENLRRACASACKLAGVKTIAPNALRHTNASMLLDRGATPAEVARHLGHINTRMVTTTYGHAMREVVPTARLLEVAE